MIWFYLLSGLFLGWSLGANDAANIFGTAVGTRMVRFKIAAIISSIFVILGAVISGEATTATLESLGAVNAMAGSFTVALSSAITVTWMTKYRLPVSTSQAIIGGIIGWNFFTYSATDWSVLKNIVIVWVASVLLAGVFAIFIFKISKSILNNLKIHLLKLDLLTRLSLIFVGAFGAYSLGANNVANVIGVFVPAVPFHNISISNIVALSGSQQLFILGGIAIAAGIFTYSFRVMVIVGNDLFKLTPITALIAVMAESMVLFLFASQNLSNLLSAVGLPKIPLVPVSSSQAIIGAVIGISIVKGGRGINYSILGKIAGGWVVTPLIAFTLTYFALFFVQNVFKLTVVNP